MSSNVYGFRPHHFLCTLGFEGKGYSPEFVANYSQIARTLNAPGGDEQLIQVTHHADAICAPCPNRVDQGCTEIEKIRTLDQAHSAMLGIEPGQVMTWGEAKKLIKERVTLEGFNKACAPCSWKALGVCENALGLLKTTDPERL